VIVAAVLVTLTGVTLSACDSSASGLALAQEACVHVHNSVRDYSRSTVAGTPAPTVTRLQNQAAQELRAALPLAAAANSDDGSWNSLMTVISESATVDMSHLVPSLRAQCAVADSNDNQNVNPQSPST
jgi:hypothetical protein